MYHYILWHHIFENFQIFQRAIELLQQLTMTTWQTTVEERFYMKTDLNRACMRKIIHVCNQDDTMIYNRHGGGGEPCRDKQISVRKK